jgi:alkanesulfonate monooxygenase SsuD/methylene tetrahydromethanopterin reductase-like flavin-dependent oxidoreductase (luciferase family)
VPKRPGQIGLGPLAWPRCTPIGGLPDPRSNGGWNRRRSCDRGDRCFIGGSIRGMVRPAIGYIPVRLSGSRAAQWRALLAEAEHVGLDHVGIGDHVSFYTGMGADGLLGVSVVLAASERLAANTAVYLLPLRHPVITARQVSDIGALAPGRFLFGVGIGGEDPHEVELCGVDPRTRGRRMDECLRVIRALLMGETVNFEGDFFTLREARIAPAPTEPIPIVVGGRSDAAIRRAGRLGDGWFGVWVSSRRYGEAIAQMEAAASDAGRTVPEWTNALNVWCGVGDSSDEARSYLAPAMEAFYQLPFERFERWSPAGNPRQIAEFLVPYAVAGCSVFNLIINGRDGRAEVQAAGEIRDLILQEAPAR